MSKESKEDIDRLARYLKDDKKITNERKASDKLWLEYLKGDYKGMSEEDKLKRLFE